MAKATDGEYMMAEKTPEAVAAEKDAATLGIVTRDKARKARKQDSEGLIMPLPLTGGVARVKRLSLMDKVGMGYIPDSIQQRVMQSLNRPDARTAKEMERNRKETLEVADAFCLAGFITPRLVATEDQVDEHDPYCMCVTDLHPEERIGYFLNCVGRDSGSAMRFRQPPDES